MKDARRVVVTGASRGLGLEFVRQLLQAGWHVQALLRNPDGSTSLQLLLQESGDRLTAVSCDVADPRMIAEAADQVASRWPRLDLLINNAGISSASSGGTGHGIERLDLADLRRVFEVNVHGAIEMTRCLLPLLRQAEGAKVIHVTSKMGSMADNDSGGWWAYRMSKAALNMAAVNMAHEFRAAGIATMVIHPGWVRTDMGGAAAPLDAESSVSGMIEVIEALSMRDTGCFRDYSGANVPW